MSVCWRCGNEIDTEGEKLINRGKGSVIRAHFVVGVRIIRDERKRFVDVTCAGGK